MVSCFIRTVNSLLFLLMNGRGWLSAQVLCSVPRDREHTSSCLCVMVFFHEDRSRNCRKEGLGVFYFPLKGMDNVMGGPPLVVLP